jgi:hypothetical protein
MNTKEEIQIMVKGAVHTAEQKKLSIYIRHVDNILENISDGEFKFNNVLKFQIKNDKIFRDSDSDKPCETSNLEDGKYISFKVGTLYMMSDVIKDYYKDVFHKLIYYNDAMIYIIKYE